MERETRDMSGPSRSKSVHQSKGSASEELDEKVKRFLDEDDSDADALEEGSPESKKHEKEFSKKLKKGSPLTNEEINTVIETLGKNIDMFNIDKEYNEFLNKYGCIYGQGFKICGPTENVTDSEMKIECITSIQRGFEYRCSVNKMTAEQTKSCWLIAKEDQGDQYYINVSKSKKWLIYSMNLYGKSKPFARNFLEFLDKFYEAYEMKTEEEDSEEYS